MPFRDLREYLRVLEEHQDLLRVRKPVDLHLEVGRILAKSYSQQGPAILFENPIGSEVPLLAGLFSNRRKTLLAFETDEEHILEKVLAGMKKPVPPVLKERGECQDQVITEKIDLSRFPIPFYTPKDGGKYLTAGITVSKDPETGVPDIGHYRYQVIGPDRAVFSGAAFSSVWQELDESKEKGEPF